MQKLFLCFDLGNKELPIAAWV